MSGPVILAVDDDQVVAAAIVADQRMSQMTGIEMLQQAISVYFVHRYLAKT